MKPKPRPEASQLHLFQAQFDQLLNLDHPLCVLARKIDWQRFDIAFADCYSPDTGAPGKDIRLLVGLHYLKHTFNESDESLLDRWLRPLPRPNRLRESASRTPSSTRGVGAMTITAVQRSTSPAAVPES